MENTTNPTETVQVPVKLLKNIAEILSDTGYPFSEKEVRDLIPAPEPRLVVVDLDKVHGMTGYELVTSLRGTPDLFTTLDAVIDEWWRSDSSDDEDDLKARIRAAFGVTS